MRRRVVVVVLDVVMRLVLIGAMITHLVTDRMADAIFVALMLIIFQLNDLYIELRKANRE